MATVTKLAIYNYALTLLGQRTLSSDVEDVPHRHTLDVFYDLGAPEACLEIVKPNFAATVAKLTTSSASAEHDLDNEFTLPADYLTLAGDPNDPDDTGVYIDAQLDQPLKRYMLHGTTLACVHSTIYIRYIDSTVSITLATPSFARVVGSYLAMQAATKINPGKKEEATAAFTENVKVAMDLDARRSPKRPSVPTVTLTNDWRNIYNDALLVMGLPEIATNDDDSNRRTKLDRALDTDLVSEALEDTGWTFALQSVKSTYDSSIEPEWGYTRAHPYPPKLHRLDGIYSDPYMREPIKLYVDEGDFFYCDYDTIYLQYVSTDFLTNPANWPTFFRKLVAGKMAKLAAPSLKDEGADPARADAVCEDRESEAESNDAMSSPPRILAEGNWVRSRSRGRDRDRP